LEGNWWLAYDHRETRAGQVWSENLQKRGKWVVKYRGMDCSVGGSSERQRHAAQQVIEGVVGRGKESRVESLSKLQVAQVARPCTRRVSHASGAAKAARA